MMALWGCFIVLVVIALLLMAGLTYLSEIKDSLLVLTAEPLPIVASAEGRFTEAIGQPGARKILADQIKAED